MAHRWTGVFPAVTTKFNADESLDLAATTRHIRWQIECGADGIIVCGSLGEASTLTAEEKITILKAAKEVAGDKPVLLTVAEDSTRAACALAQAAHAAGADGIMLLPAMRYVSDERETLNHYQRVADASPLPIMIYNNPVAYGVNITPAMYAQMADEPKYVAIKESSGDIRTLTNIINAVGDRFAIFSGVDDLALESLMMGADGWVAGLVVAFPKETVAIYRLARAGRWDEARRIYRWFAPLLHLDVSMKLVQNLKLAETMVGMGTEHVRAPRMPLTGTERERVQAVIEAGLASRPVLPAL
ncbi:Dihydrodipicolinate synthase/N-acetylneuraminate lyase [Gulbenkiania indica]|uniref:Dihydrodipicolinate synthase/N-acetylneuraminate lyase n=2 Tax=Gulbenkiania TaxID=397456 RepID=A0A0K6GT68_9NEIS|nr:dihydrodipicolinate synthase family protein [Gulbenkiania indica]TCW32472.1 4-hydroxy-tetrahydrodipicolinate synthase [Gulbenkiania mobilis]CUA81733.1 Dihydrodipicolinate synthase/N-acetylneuraminate lyase [Gulbenkiania indica]